MDAKNLRSTMFLMAMLGASDALAAGVSLQFEEDAPKDRFIILNEQGCTIEQADLKIDLSGSQAGLLFDTQAGGAGVNVYQPLEVAQGREWIAELGGISDGASELELRVTQLPAGAEIVLTVDVDDSLPSGPMGTQMIATSEIAGASVTWEQGAAGSIRADFDASGRAVLNSGC